jgi:hypothetical protein
LIDTLWRENEGRTHHHRRHGAPALSVRSEQL